MDRQIDNIVLIAEIDHQPHRFAETAPARQPVAGNGIEPAVGGEQDQLVGGLGPERPFGPVAVLVFDLAKRFEMTLGGLDPSLFRNRSR